MKHAALDAFVMADFRPAYLDPEICRSLPQRAANALEQLRYCRACPRDCKVNRLADETGVCGTGRYALVSSAFPHLGEENCLRGWRGSGTIFFSMCNLQCVFCQNWDISHRRSGQPMDASTIADELFALQTEGCHNINLVTPTHVGPQIVEALAVAVDRGLRLPIVYNTSAYDAVESLRPMDGLVDIYMPDFRFWSIETAHRLAKAKDYPGRAREAIREMHRQVGVLKFTPDGLACRGVLVRHLVMPGQIEESRAILRWLAEELSPDTYVNVMAQYHPAHDVCRIGSEGHETDRPSYAEINRCPTRSEVEAAYRAARDAGLWRFDGPGIREN
jgi:putative pyruvate formate lyase activating enzyme